MASSPTPLKRKRDDAAPPADELEIDLSLPEPLSKKAARKAKRPKKAADPTKGTLPPTAAADDDSDPSAKDDGDGEDERKLPRRSEHAIWIGNLPWTATKLALRSFLREQAGVPESAITRLHMPAPDPSPSARKGEERPVNKGFAYVDLSTAAHQRAALAASERALGGRRVLIKDARSFEGRPEPAAPSSAADGAGAGKAAAAAGSRDKPPSRRVFVGNLAFDVTRDDLERHFSQCGELADVFLATFEDSGKCKGFGWVTFAEVAGAVAAVRGWILREQDDDGEGKKRKPRRWTVNKLAGRVLRCEFAEDPALRYRKRFGKKKEGAAGVPEEEAPPAVEEVSAGDGAGGGPAARKKQTSAHERRRAKRKAELVAQT
jgi:hypothetical protein